MSPYPFFFGFCRVRVRVRVVSDTCVHVHTFIKERQAQEWGQTTNYVPNSYGRKVQVFVLRPWYIQRQKAQSPIRLKR